jgi:hypothetical protein
LPNFEDSYWLRQNSLAAPPIVPPCGGCSETVLFNHSSTSPNDSILLLLRRKINRKLSYRRCFVILIGV